MMNDIALMGGFTTIPEEMNKAIFFADVEMVWNRVRKSFISKGKIGIGSIKGNSINKMVDGYIELAPRRTGDIINIYIALNKKDWFFFTYTRGTMKSISSYDDFNDYIVNLKDKERKPPVKDEDNPYMFFPGSERSKENFLTQISIALSTKEESGDFNINNQIQNSANNEEVETETEEYEEEMEEETEPEIILEETENTEEQLLEENTEILPEQNQEELLEENTEENNEELLEENTEEFNQEELLEENVEKLNQEQIFKEDSTKIIKKENPEKNKEALKNKENKTENTQDKEKVKEKKKVSKLNKYGWFRYIKLVFGTRVLYRQSTAIWFVPLGFSFLFGIVTFYINLTHVIYPPLPLEEMSTEKGVIKSIVKRRKMDDLLTLTTKDGKEREFAFNSSLGEDTLVNQNVTVWYKKGMSSAFTVDNIIYEITRDGKTIRTNPYDYEHRVGTQKSAWTFVKYCLYTTLFSLLMIWIGNRKELPVHRLGRIKFNKHIKEDENGSK
jgi:hypothetical protein